MVPQAFQFNYNEICTFFAVLVRFSVLVSIVPWLGERSIPTLVKIFLSVAITVCLFPVLVNQNIIQPEKAERWSNSIPLLAQVIGLEALFALVLGFSAKIVFQAIQFGGNLAGNFMGFGMATYFDPFSETQSQVVAEIHMAFAMLLFLGLDAHHLLLRAMLGTYSWVGLGEVQMGAGFSEFFIQLTKQVLYFGLVAAAPVAVCIFLVNLVFGVLAKAMPQLNALVLSFSVTALVGIAVLYLSLPEFTEFSKFLFTKMPETMVALSKKLGGA